MSDTISRAEAIDAVNAATVITNPEHFKGHEKFTGFMEDEDISSFGKWERANGFNTALVETRILLGKLPSAQPERRKGRWVELSHGVLFHIYKCDQCGSTIDVNGINVERGNANFCPNCGADMRGESDDQ